MLCPAIGTPWAKRCASTLKKCRRIQEASEEGLGRVSVNRAVGEVDPAREWSQGVGEAAGMGAVGGGVMGGVMGMASKEAAPDQPTTDIPNAAPPSDNIPNNDIPVDQVRGMPDDIPDTALAADPAVFDTGPLSRAANAAAANPAAPRRDIGGMSAFDTGFPQVSELADLAAQEQADIEQRRAGILQQRADMLGLRRESELESADNRVAGAQSAEARSRRLQLLDDIYSNPDERAPGMTFLERLEAEFPRDPLPTPEEKAVIARRESAWQGFRTASPDALSSPAQEPDKPNTPRAPEVQAAQVDAYLRDGYRPISGGRMLANDKGKKLFLTAVQREYVQRLKEAQGGQSGATGYMGGDTAGLDTAGAIGTGDNAQPSAGDGVLRREVAEGAGRVGMPGSSLATDADSGVAPGEVRPDAVERYQWKRNKEGGQEFGNQQEIHPLTEPLYEEHVRDKVEGNPDYATYRAQYPDATHIGLYSQDQGKTWRVDGVGTQDQLRPDNPQWAKQVASFEDADAVAQGNTADSEVKQPAAPPRTETQQPTPPTPASAGVSVSNPASQPIAVRQSTGNVTAIAAPVITRTGNGGLSIAGHAPEAIQKAADSVGIPVTIRAGSNGVSLVRAAGRRNSEAVLPFTKPQEAKLRAALSGEMPTRKRRTPEQVSADAKSEEATKRLNAEIRALADEYGVEKKFRQMSDVRKDVETAIEREIGSAGADYATVRAHAIVQGISEQDLNAAVDKVAGRYVDDTSMDSRVRMFREMNDAIQEVIDEVESRESSEEGQRTEPDLSAQDAEQAGVGKVAPETSSAEAGNVKPGEFIKSPEGSIDFGEITPDMAEVMRRQAGKVRLEVGNADYGLTHIERRHGAQIRGMGFKSVAEFVADAVRHIESIWSPHKTSQMVMIQAHEKGKAVFIQLKPSESGEFYTVNTAFPVSEGYAEQKKWKMLWSGESVPTVASGATSFADPARKAGEQVAMTSSQSSGGNIRQPAAESKPSPEQQAAAILDRASVTGKDRLDIMRDFRDGKHTLADLEAAYPAEAKDNESPSKPATKPDGDLLSEGVDNETPERLPATDTDVSRKGEKIDTSDGRVKETPENRQIEEPAQGKPQGSIEDFGEKLGGARKDLAAAIKQEYSDQDIADLPLSKIWPADLAEKIEDKFVAAFAFAARQEIPSKPRVKYKVDSWVQKVKILRDMAGKMTSSETTKEHAAELLKETKGLEGFNAKVALMQAIDREQWKRIGKVWEYPNAYSYDAEGKRVPASSVQVEIDDKRVRFDGAKSVADVIGLVNGALGVEAQAKRMEFEVRGRGDSWAINKKGDPLYRKLKTFTDSKTALDFKRDNYADLVAAWEAVKDSDNVREADLRTRENRERTAEDWRKGKDVTPEQFISELGFRGVEFGLWVKQGKNAKERQGMLNAAYDALMDLASIINVPPRALSLDGTLGLGFGSRGSGAASAHFEPDTLVINLTKTRGAGTLAHEWFHALDNYFQSKRGKPATRSREEGYITYNPENYYVHKQSGRRLPARAFNTMIEGESHPVYGRIAAYARDKAQWEFKEGVRTEVGEAFADLVKALNDSPMAKRASLLDKSKSGGYWSRIIERGARSFENYVIHKMMLKGYHNDYLANVTPESEFKRNDGRYPYLLEGEIQPVAEAFDNLFATIQTKETDKGVALYSASSRIVPENERLSAAQLSDIVDKVMANLAHQPKVVIVDSLADNRGNGPDDAGRASGEVRNGTIYLYRDAIADGHEAVRTLWHELLHYGIRRFLSADEYIKAMRSLSVRDGYIRKLAGEWARSPAADEARRYAASRPELKDRVDAYAFARGVDEMLSRFAESIGANGTPYAKNDAYHRTMRAVRSWLAWLADKTGMKPVGDWIRGKDNEAAREYVHNMLGKLRRDDPASNDHWAFTADGAYMVARHDSPYDHEAVAKKTQTVESIKQATANLRARWLGFRRVKIVQSVREIPNDLYMRSLRADRPIDQGTEGIYDPASKTVYLIADNIATPERAVWVAAHEVVGHGGLRMLDRSVVSALDFAGKNGFVKKLARAIAADRGETFDAREHTDEAVAELAAAIITGNPDAILERYGVKVPAGMRSNLLGMVRRLVDAVRQFIGRVTGKPVEAVSDGEVLGLLRQMEGAVEGKAQGYDTAGVSQGVMASNAAQARLYSQLRRAVNNAPDRIFATGKQAALWLDANTAKLGVKKEEVYWTGVGDWLRAQGKISKDEVLNYLDANGVQVREVMLGSGNLPLGWEVRRNDSNGLYDVVNPDGEVMGVAETEDDAIAQAREEMGEDSGTDGDTKFAKWQLPGGDNYRELLLTLPIKKVAPTAYEVAPGRWATKSGKATYPSKEMAESYAGKVDAPSFKSGHFDQPNVLAHIRFNERTDADGNKVLFLEEVQSDWGQKGKKQGFALPKAEHDALEARRRELEKSGGEMRNRGEEIPTEMKREWADIMNRLQPETQHLKPTSAPFVTDTKSWTALALKRVIAYAAENGFNRVAWATGEQQAARYDLSKQIESIDYKPNGDDTFDVEVHAQDRGGVVFSENDIDLARVEEVMGKEIAQKMINGEGRQRAHTWKTLSDLNLKVGGEGMKGYYDQIVPQVANDILRKVGGGKVEITEIGHPRKGRDATVHIAEQPGFTITPQMRAKVIGEGLPLFSRRAQEGGAVRSAGIPKDAALVADFRNDIPLKRHADYKAAKAGDMDAAARLVQAVVKTDSLEAAKKAFGGDVIYVPVHAEEASGRNKIPNALALYYAAETGAEVDDSIVQANRAFHTGANAMERLLARAEFDGNVAPGGRYVLVDDVSTMGSTLADMAGYIRSHGGEVAGSVVLVNATRSGMMTPETKTIRELEARHGNEISKLFGIEPGALTSSESQYLLGFRTTEELRNRVAKARQERIARLRAKGILSEGADSQGVNQSGTAPLSFRAPAQQTPSRSRFVIPEETSADKIQRKHQDSLNRIKIIQNAIAEQGGIINEQNNVYQAMERLTGRVAARQEDFTDNVVEPLMKRVAELDTTTEELGTYLMALGAKDRNAYIQTKRDDMPDNGSGMSNDEAAEIIADYRKRPDFAAFDKLARDIQKVTDAKLEVLVGGNVITRAQADEMGTAMGFYVPYKGFEIIDDDGNRAGNGIGGGYSTSKRASKQAMGRISRAGQVVENIFRDFHAALFLSEKAHVGRALHNLVTDNPDPTLWTEDKPVKTPVMGADGKVQHRDMGFDNTREVRYILNGEEVRIQLYDPIMAAAYNNLNATQMNGMLEVAGDLNRFLRQMYTQKNPEFISTNFLRDAQTAFAVLTGEGGADFAMRAMRHVPGAARAMFKHDRHGKAGNVWDAYYDYARRNGALTAFAMLDDLETQQLKLDAAIARHGGGGVVRAWQQGLSHKGTLLDKTGKAVSGASKVILYRLLDSRLLMLIENLNHAAENSYRMAAFRAYIDDHGGLDKATPKVLAEASRIAKNVTVNFNRRGEQSRAWNAAYLFWNANVQGTQNMFRAATQTKHKRQVQAILAGLFALGVFASMMTGDDDDELTSEYDKEHNLLLHLGGETTVKLILAYGLGFFFGAGYTVGNLIQGRVKPMKAAVSILGQFMDHFTPVGSPINDGEMSSKSVLVAAAPTMLAPLAMSATNTNAFGNKLVPHYSDDDGKSDRETMYRSTRGTLYDKAANSSLLAWADVSPETLKMATGFLTGGTGTFASNLVATASDVAQGEAPDIERAPFIRKIVSTKDVEEYRGRFYRQLDDVKKTAGEHDIKQSRVLGTSVVFWQKRMKALRDKEDEVRAGGDRAGVKLAEKRQVELAMSLNARYHKAMERVEAREER